MNSIDLRQITDFFSKYELVQINPETFLLRSKRNNLMVKYHKVSADDEEIFDILDKHLSFDSQYVCPLLSFQRCQNGGESSVRAIYQLDRLTLKESIDLKKQKEEYFSEAEIWILLSSLVNSLIYLQEKEVVYGVLSPSKIFVQEKIRVMDPSAFNVNPVNVSRLSLQSPEIRDNLQDIDFYMSDVYLLGLCMLSTATLTELSNSPSQTEIQALLDQVQQNYSSDLLHVLKYMLKDDVQDRPSFHNIREYIETEIQIREAKVNSAEVLLPDEEDTAVEDVNLQQIDVQVVDVLQMSPLQEEFNAHEQARQRYLFTSRFKTKGPNANCHASTIESLQNIQPIQFVGHKDTLNLKSSNYFVQEFKLAQVNSNPNDTVLKSRNRAHQIKKRNSQNVKPIRSITIPSFQENPTQIKNPFTSPQILTMLMEQTKRAREFFTVERGRD